MLRALILLALAGCSSEIAEVQTGSSSVAVRPGVGQFLVVTPSEDRLSLVNVGLERSVDLDVGADPTRVALIGDRAIVTLRGERSLVEVDVETGRIGRRVETGVEPFGVVANPDGRTFFVSLAQEGRVEQRSVDSLEVLRSFEVGGTPQGMALHPDGHLLVVAFAFGNTLTVVDLFDGSTSPLPLPEHTTFAQGSVIDGEVVLDSRVTADPIFTADGDRLIVPALYVDTRSGEMGGGETGLSVPSAPYYKQPPVVSSMGRFNASLVQFDVDRHGELERTAQVTSRVIDVAPGSGPGLISQSVISGVAEAPDGLGWLVSMQDSDTVLLVDDRYRETWKRRTRLAFPQASAVGTARGPTGIAVIDPQRIFVHQRLDRSLADVKYRTLSRKLKRETGQGMTDEDDVGPTARGLVDRGVSLGASSLDPLVEQGRSLFHDAVSPEMGEAGVSCSTCHVDGRNDGLTWTLFNGERNTPSLAGPVDEAGVITWTNDIESVSHEARFTVEHRMGVQRASPALTDAIAAFVASTPYADRPAPEPDAVQRGQALFESEEVGCAGCHTGAFYTDGKTYDMYGIQGVKTRPLVGISSSAPYLHDGSAPTLRDVLITARGGEMGNTGSLSEDELDDLVAFLESL